MNDIKYIGMDVHQASIVIAVLDRSGKLVMESIIETRGETILQFIRGLRGTLHVTFEEGVSADWLHELLVPYVARVLVCDPRKNALLKSGNKNDRIDAHKLAGLLRAGLLTAVYHGESRGRLLKELARSYRALTKDTTRVMNRLKSLYHSRRFAAGAPRCTLSATGSAGWSSCRRRARAAGPNDFTSNWTCCNRCAGRPARNW